MADRYKYFIIEAGEILAELTAGLLALEKRSSDRELVKKLLRFLHSLKGAAGVVRLSGMARLSHAMEERLIRCRERNRPVRTEDITILLDATTLLEKKLEAVRTSVPEDRVDSSEILAALEAEAQEEPSTGGQESETEEANTDRPVEEETSARSERSARKNHTEQLGGRKGEETVMRVKTADLNRMTTLSNEILINTAWLKSAIEPFGKVVRRLKWTDSNSRLGEELERSVDNLERKIVSSVALSREMAETIKTTHLVPVRNLCLLFEKAVRDLALETGKSVRFDVEGSEERLSRFLLDRVREPLFHILRNSVVHGIESAQERKLSGKESVGTIRLRFGKETGLVRIVCHDDGRGMDAEELRKAAVERNVVTAEAAAAMSDEDVLYLTLAPGFSSVGKVSELAGRGVGLDVVKESVSSLGGSIAIESKKGSFSRLTLRLPLTTDVLSVFSIRISGRDYLIPFKNVIGTRQIVEEDILWEAGRRMIAHEGTPIPLIELADILRIPPSARSTGRANVVLVGGGLGTVGLIVDSLSGRIEIMPKALRGELANLMGVGSSAILSNGDPAFVLDVDEIIERTKTVGKAETETAEKTAKPPIMVVDDSQTTRLLIDGILKSEGYETVLAQSGEEALEILGERSFGLFVTDIQMPGIDGFELTERLRGIGRYEEVPIVILSSMGSDEDKRRGIAVGADAYFVKSQFAEEEFLSTVESLLP